MAAADLQQIKLCCCPPEQLGPQTIKARTPEQAAQVVHAANRVQRQAVDLDSPSGRVPAHIQAELAARRQRRCGAVACCPPAPLQGREAAVAMHLVGSAIK